MQKMRRENMYLDDSRLRTWESSAVSAVAELNAHR